MLLSDCYYTFICNSSLFSVRMWALESKTYVILSSLMSPAAGMIGPCVTASTWVYSHLPGVVPGQVGGESVDWRREMSFPKTGSRPVKGKSDDFTAHFQSTLKVSSWLCCQIIVTTMPTSYTQLQPGAWLSKRRKKNAFSINSKEHFEVILPFNKISFSFYMDLCRTISANCRLSLGGKWVLANVWSPRSACQETRRP